MKVVIEMTEEELKKYLTTYAGNHFKQLEGAVGFLSFQEGEYRHPDDCKEDHENLFKEGKNCPRDGEFTRKNYNTTFRILQINP